MSDEGRLWSDQIGIMQGRLVGSATGELDCPPGPRWREELPLAAGCGLAHLELVAEKIPTSNNPIWSAGGRRELLALAAGSGVQLPSLCMNESVVTAFDDVHRAADLAGRLTPVVSDLPVDVVVVPLLEASDLDVIDRTAAAQAVSVLAERLAGHGVRLALEVGVPADEALEFLASVPGPPVGLCYDTGNASALGLDPPAELDLLADHVWHLHAKDKDGAGRNVRFGTGMVPFGRVFAVLNEQRFEGLVTMEAMRGEDPALTAAEHRAYLLSASQPAGKFATGTA